MRWADEVGLLLDVIGALTLVSGLMIDRTRALELGLARLSGETDEENLKLPQVRARLIESRNSKIRAVFLVPGFIGQAVGNWPS
ncbi:MAG TPA: hypothetical protein VFB25_07150 [Gaiellaceae bacterium]|nr:hypothetical protein [Gaiellaceae bacterium]